MSAENKTKVPRTYKITVALTSLAVAIAILCGVLPSLFAQQKAPTPTLRNPEVTVGDDGESMLGQTQLYPSSGIADTPFGAMLLSKSSEEMTTPVDVSENGILTLTVEEATDAETLKKTISITPMADFTISATSDTTFSIVPTTVWEKDTVYRITVGDVQNPAQSCAFQTERDFAVKHVYPADKRTDIPTNTGIEITFTAPVRKADLAACISVYPPIDGSFSLYPDGKTVVIVPDKELSLNTEYTVTVDDTLCADNGKALIEGRSFRFRTTGGAIQNEDLAFGFSIAREAIVSPRTMPTLSYELDTWNTNKKFSVAKASVTAQIYKYESFTAAQNAIWDAQSKKSDAYYGSTDTVYTTKGLKLVYDGTPSTEILSQSTTNLRGLLTLPAQENGCYLVNVSMTVPYSEPVTDQNGNRLTEHTETLQVLLQITPLRAYTEAADGKALIWVNRTDTKAPVADVRISGVTFFEEGYWSKRNGGKGDTSPLLSAAITDDNGVACMEIGDDNRGIFVLNDGGDELLVCATLDESKDLRDLRYYIYTDREVYFSNDKVNIFGVIGKTDASSVLPKTLELRVGSQARGTRIAVSDDGTFTASFSIEAWTAYGISFGFYDENEVQLASKFVRVTQQSKPVYTMDLSFDRLYYTYGQKVTATATLSFFDGTPAPDLEIRFSSNPYGSGTSVKTDANGKAVYTFKAGAPRGSSTSPDHLYVSAELIGYESAYLYQGASVLYFHSIGVLRAERISGTESHVYLNTRDLAKIKSSADLSYPDYPENTYGDARSDTVSIVLYKTEYVKVDAGTVYDPITKTAQKRYNYKTVKTRVSSESKAFSDGVIVLEHLDASGFDGYYSYEVSWTDPENKHIYRQNVYANKGSALSYNRSNLDQYTLQVDTQIASLGDTVHATLQLGNHAAESANALITFYYGKEAMADIVHASTYTFTFGKEHMLGTHLYAVVFDGESYVLAGDAAVVYDYQKNQKMELSIITDKPSYRPGEEVNVKVKGENAANATVLISLVDEACFALGAQNVLPLDNYISSITNDSTLLITAPDFEDGDSTYIYTYLRSYTIWPVRNQRFSAFISDRYGLYYTKDDAVETEAAADMAEPGATNGGMGEDPVDIREVFADNPTFTVLTLDENGEGTLALTLPDNITTWRATAIGVLGANESDLSKLRIGSAVSQTVCTLPYFINVSSPELFIQGDEISLSARSYGTAVESGNASVAYTAVLYDDSGKWLGERTATSKPHEHAWFSFGKLDNGTYSVVVTGRMDGNADALRVYFTVTESAFVMPTERHIKPGELSSLEILGYPVTLTFYDETYTLYLDVISRLASQGTSRNDALAARYIADLAAKKFGNNGSAWFHIYRGTDNAKATLASYEGLIPVLEHAEGDIAFSAKLIYCAPDVLTAEAKARLVRTFYELLAKREYADETELCALYLGLAAAGEPVLDALYDLASSAANYPLEAKLYLSAAFAAAGDHGAAYSAWSTICAQYGKESEDGYFLLGENTAMSIQSTALGLLTATRVDRANADRMVCYLLTHTSKSDLHVIELAAYLTAYLPQKVEDISFTYRFGDMEKAETVTITGGERMTLSLTKSQYESLAITDADEALRIRASYGASAEEALLSKAETATLTVKKTVTPYNEAQGLWLVTVSYEGMTDRDYLSFALADCIPSGARFVQSGGKRTVSDSTSYGYLSHNGGQMLTGYISAYNPHRNTAPAHNMTYTFRGEICYVIRGAVKGTFQMEPTVAISYDMGTYACSDALEITIKDGAWKIKNK